MVATCAQKNVHIYIYTYIYLSLSCVVRTTYTARMPQSLPETSRAKEQVHRTGGWKAQQLLENIGYGKQKRECCNGCIALKAGKHNSCWKAWGMVCVWHSADRVLKLNACVWHPASLIRSLVVHPAPSRANLVQLQWITRKQIDLFVNVHRQGDEHSCSKARS